MEAGKLRHRISYQTSTSTQDASGQPIETWADTVTVWASVEPLSGKRLELAKASTVTATATHHITTRYVDGITANMRIKYGTRIFTINGAVLNTDERNRELHITATEVTV